MKTANSRAIAATILARLEAGKGSLDTHLDKHRELADGAFLQEVLYGCCRWFFLLEHLANQLLNKPLKRKDNELKCLLIVGLYQLRHLSTPPYAAINETVAATSVLGKPWGKALVNAVLRGYLREAESLEATLSDLPPALAQSHPAWLQQAISAQWPASQDQIMAANNSRPPMTLRVNLGRTTRNRMLQTMADAGIGATAGALADSALYLETPMPVTLLPGFDEGLGADGEAAIAAYAAEVRARTFPAPEHTFADKAPRG